MHHQIYLLFIKANTKISNSNKVKEKLV